ncbi:Ada metal-binding domain-containing protein [Modestobacter lapidis]|nr:hypothetical protein [Modestobacter lapidis]
MMATTAAPFRLVGPDGREHPSDRPGTVGGHRRSRIYGRLDCPAALRALARGGYRAHRVFFADEHTAIQAGYRPCGGCLPGQHRNWKRGVVSTAAHPEEQAADMTDSPYAIPAEDLIRSARIERGEQVEVRPVPDTGGGDRSPGLHPYGDGAGGDVDGD